MSLLDDVSLMITPNGVAEDVLFGVLPTSITGNETITDGQFPTGTSAWTTGAGWTISGNKAHRDGSGGSNSSIDQSISVVIGKQYKFSYTRTYASGNGETNLYVKTNGVDYVTLGSYVSTVVEEHIVTGYFTALFTGSMDWRVFGIGTFTGTMDNISVKEYTSADMDFTRATTATRVNSDELVEECPRNLLKYSQEIDNVTWSKTTAGTGSAPVVTANDIVSPDGTQNAEKVVFDLNGGTSGSDYSLLSQTYTQTTATYSLSCYLKGESGGEKIFMDFDSQNTNIVTLTTDWVRYTLSKTLTTTGSRTIRFGTRGSVATDDNPTVYIWGCQFEVGSQATNYIYTTDRLNVPRIDYTDVSCPHILSEPNRTNLVTDSAKGTYGNSPGSYTRGAAPDGTDTAYINVPDSDSDRYHAVIAAGTYATDTKLTYSWYRKRISTPTDATKVGDLDITALVNSTQVGSTTEIASDINGFDRFSATFNITNGAAEAVFRFYFGPVIGIGNSSVAYWGHQLELGTYSTSLIPTSGSTVTRNSDIFERTGIADLINSAEGVFYVEIAALADDLTYREIALSDGTANNRIEIRYHTVSNQIQALLRVGGVALLSLSYTVTDIKDFHKVAFKYKTGDNALWVDGTERAVITTAHTMPSLNRLAFDQGSSGNNFRGKVRNLQVYKTALTDSQLTSLTT